MTRHPDHAPARPAPTASPIDADQLQLYQSDLWLPAYAAIWLNIALLAGLIFLPPRAFVQGFSWSVVLAVLTAVVGTHRILIHDLIVTFNYREHLGMGVLTLAFFLAPAFFDNYEIVPHGFLWAALVPLALAISPTMVRRLLGLTLVGAWFAALHLNDPLELAALLAFGVSWLLALGMAHVAFLADTHGLRGRWPAVRLLRSVVAVVLPATIAGGLACLFWPGAWAPGPRGGYTPPARVLNQVDPIELYRLFVHLGIFVLVMAVVLGALYLWRRWLMRRQRHLGAGELLPGQQATLSYAPDPEELPPPTLPGLRGQVVKLWGRWERALGREGYTRRPGETATEYADRLAAESPDASPPADLTRLLDQAHYSPDAIDRDDVRRMRALVQDELSRQSLRRQSPVEPMD
jgi:hypothetical protein